MDWSKLSTVNVFLNTCGAALLLSGYINIRRGNRSRHKQLMLMALSVSVLFLISYLFYHAQAGSVPYPYHDWTRVLYFIILIPHVILAMLMVPFIAAAVYYALQAQFEKHKRIVKYLWPVWMYVSLSGIVVYMMLYIF